MSVKIRLQRYGRKKQAYYHIVVADARAPRDGKFIEMLGNYNPNTNPASININLDKAVSWLENGAQPTETCRAILSYKGALHKLHLKKGVAKGAFTAEQAETRFEEWLNAKTEKVEAKKSRLTNEKESSLKERMARETKIKADIAKKVAAKNTPPADEPAEEEVAVAEEQIDAPVAEVENNDAPAAEETATTEETPAAEESNETSAEGESQEEEKA